MQKLLQNALSAFVWQWMIKRKIVRNIRARLTTIVQPMDIGVVGIELCLKQFANLFSKMNKSKS